MHWVTKNVFTVTYVSSPKHLGCNPSFVVTSEGCVLIDSPQQPSEAWEYKHEIDKKGGARYLIQTEPHADHYMSNFLFNTTVVGHELLKRALENPPVRDDMNKWLRTHGFAKEAEERVQRRERNENFMYNMIKNTDPKGAILYKNWRLCPPTITYKGQRMTLYIGNHTFHIIHTPGHTVGQSAVYIPEEKIVFTGDNIFYRVTPLLQDENQLHSWLESLKKIHSLDVEYIVPGHGGVCDKSGIKEMEDYLHELINAVQEGINKGWTREECAEKLHSRFAYRYPVSRGLERTGGSWTYRNLTWTYDELIVRKNSGLPVGHVS